MSDPLTRPRPPIVTLTTDFGLLDPYVAEIKGRILSLCPEASLVDVSHTIPAHDVEAGAYVLARAAPAFPDGTIHVAVVDPGVGSARRALVVEYAGASFVGPDNGILAPFLDGARVLEIDAARLGGPAPAPTFHGRDLFAPAAARLARGEPADRFARPCAAPSRPAEAGPYRIIHVDRFGNCVTSIPARALPAGSDLVLAAGGRRIARRVTTYAEARPGEAVYLVGSAGQVEIAVREGRAVDLLGLERGQPITLEKGTTP